MTPEQIEQAKQELQRAVQLADGQVALARRMTELSGDRVQVSQQRISNWLKRDKRIPAECVPLIAAAVNNKVSPGVMRPDVFGVTPRRRRRREAS